MHVLWEFLVLRPRYWDINTFKSNKALILPDWTPLVGYRPM